MWTDYITDKKQWLAIFGDGYTPPNISISHAIFSDNAITLKLFSNLTGDSYPAKWIKNGYNECAFDLIINNVTTVEIINFSFYGPLDLKIKNNDNKYEIKATINMLCNFTCSASAIFITNIKAYHNDGAV
ncbi:hypothetical protein JN757_06285 [Pseudomonas granadensis]|uniref:Immunity protein 50 n=1 Tax=Pseudomonas granadensis TaxID=1421430 RepID=A0ABX7GJ05_9PSED|nr:hypothetical protein [Pseudomonas granadensis]QRK85378.1 hypothetical protein JN757_06285 [Pseudomonas granadensis]